MIVKISMTEKQADFLYAIMNNITDCTDDESVRRDAGILCKKVTDAIAKADAISDRKQGVEHG
jgi:hypothetical protein